MRFIPLWMQMHQNWRCAALRPADQLVGRVPGKCDAFWDLASAALMGGEL
jgi:hypothetical protein